MGTDPAHSIDAYIPAGSHPYARENHNWFMRALLRLRGRAFPGKA